MRSVSLTVAAVLLCGLELVACRKVERSSGVDLAREVATQIRERPRVQLFVKLAGEEATKEELDLRHRIEERIEQQNIGRLISSGSGSGFMDVTVEVENTADAISQLRKVLQSFGLLKRSSFKVIAM